MSKSFSPELTFIPLRPPHEIINKRSGERLIRRINDWLFKIWHKTGISMRAKLDPQRNPYGPNTTWVVEICPLTHFQTVWASKNDASHALFTKAIDLIITGMRERFRLAPTVVTRKGNTDLHHPGGGNHIHMGADLFQFSTNWYRFMERFHRDLAMDYANRPYARWLLAHWIGDGGSRVLINRQILADKTPLYKGAIFDRAVFCASAIEPRFMASQKNSYLTFEFRIVGMVENARQLCAAVRLLSAWMHHIRDRVISYAKPLRFSLTTAKCDSYTKEDSARAACKAWVEELGLDWSNYEEDFFQRNYVMRINHGQFV